MEVTYLLTFLGGMLADIARKVLIPQTEEWLETLLPHKRRVRNAEQNLLHLEVRERLKKMGHDPSLARHVEDDAEEFANRLDERYAAQREALVELEADRLAQSATNQAEMTMAAGERFEEADENLRTALERLKRKVDLSSHALAALSDAQQAWEAYRDAQARFEGLAIAEGGSMQPMVQASVLADMTIDRTLAIAAMRKGLTDR